jgi:hypothetical protein
VLDKRYHVERDQIAGTPRRNGIAGTQSDVRPRQSGGTARTPGRRGSHLTLSYMHVILRP